MIITRVLNIIMICVFLAHQYLFKVFSEGQHFGQIDKWAFIAKILYIESVIR